MAQPRIAKQTGPDLPRAGRADLPLLSDRPLIAVCGTHLEMARARPWVLREAAQAGRASNRGPAEHRQT